jgi:hypothetical protein
VYFALITRWVNYQWGVVFSYLLGDTRPIINPWRVHVMQDFSVFYRGLSAGQRENFCNVAGVSKKYIEAHLLYRSKKPSPVTIKKLAVASGGVLTYQGLLLWFCPEPQLD